MPKLLLILSIFISTSAFARYTQTCKVEYETQDGWSDYYTVNVIFSSGYELNTATRTYNYDMYSVYAVIFWDKGEASVIKLKNMVGCGTEIDRSCIAYHVGNMEGLDQEGRTWSICASGYCY